MKPLRLTICLLGTTVLDVEIGTPETPAVVDATESGDIGAVTDRRTTATLGFAPQREYVRHADRNDPGVVR